MDEEGQDTGDQEFVDDSVAQEDSGGGDSTNPAWNDLLGVVPSQLHSQVTPYLQQWDKNYQDGINKVHSQYEAYKPYIEHKIAPDQINYALQLMNAIETRPAEVLKALQQYTGQGQQAQTDEQGQIDDGSEVPSEFVNHPEFQKINQMVNTMAQLMVQQNVQSQESQEDEMLASELDSLHQQHGDFDEEWVLTKALYNPNVPLSQHVKAYKEFTQGIIKNVRKPGPKVLGAGGSAPDSQVDMTKIDDKGRRALITQYLQSAAQQNG